MGIGEPLTETTALHVLERTADLGWLKSMQSTPEGQALINAWVAMVTAMSHNLDDQCATGSISRAPSGRPGVCTLTLRRDAADEAFVVPKDYLFKLDSGALMRVVEDVAVADGQADVILPLATARRIELLNTVDPAFDPVLAPGEYVGAAVSQDSPEINTTGANGWRVMGPPGTAASSHTLYYVSSTAIDGAASDWLSVLGSERGQFRQGGEDGEVYRLRVRNIPDAVSPLALAVVANTAPQLDDFPRVSMRETFNDGADPAIKQDVGISYADTIFGDVDYGDDPIGVDLPEKFPRRSLEAVSLREARAYFRMEIMGQLHEPDGLVFYGDDGFGDDPVFGYADVMWHPKLISAIMALSEETNRKRSGGVQFDVYLANDVVVPAEGMVRSTQPTQGWFKSGTGWVFSLKADDISPPGSAAWGWLYRDGVVSPDATAGAVPAWDDRSYFWLRFYYRDETYIDTQNFYGSAAVHITLWDLMKAGFDPGRPIVEIAAYQYNPDGEGDFIPALAGSFCLTPFTF